MSLSKSLPITLLVDGKLINAKVISLDRRRATIELDSQSSSEVFSELTATIVMTDALKDSAHSPNLELRPAQQAEQGGFRQDLEARGHRAPMMAHRLQ